MKVACIISEYNPFHKGHEFQISETRKILGEDTAVLAVMSGNFVQRGGPALLDKWDRSEIALSCGVDLVLELPALYATAGAELFAKGGVKAALATGICTHLVFGSESGDLKKLQEAAGLLLEENEDYTAILKEKLDTGISYARARQEAVFEYSGDPALAALLESPNNILAIEYLKALLTEENSHISPLTIQRQGSGHRDLTLDGTDFVSATAIRQTLADEGKDILEITELLLDKMPSPSLAKLLYKMKTQKALTNPRAFDDEIMARLLSGDDFDPALYDGFIEGLDNRLKKLAKKSESAHLTVESLIKEAASKRHAHSTIRRALYAMLLGISKEDRLMAEHPSAPFYLRVLGFNKKGRYLLRMMRKNATLPIISRASDFREFNSRENPLLKRVAALDIAATDLYSLKLSEENGRDFKVQPISFPLQPRR